MKAFKEFRREDKSFWFLYDLLAKNWDILEKESF